MPDSPTPRPVGDDETPGPDATAPEAVGATEPDATEAGTAEPASDDETDGFTNRAARRAKAKGKSSPQQVHGKAQHLASRGSVQGPRQWGNRRTG